MKKKHEGLVNGWYYCVEDVGHTEQGGQPRYWAHIHDVMSVNRLAHFETEDDALSLIGDWRIEVGVLIEKKITERFGYFGSADNAQAVVRRACQMRAHNLAATTKEIGRFLELYGMQGHLQQ